MEEKKISFFQWFIGVLKWSRSNYDAPVEEKERVFNNTIAKINNS